MKKTSIEIYISIFWDYFNIDELSNLLNIIPTSSWYKWNRDTKFPNAPPKKETSWDYSFWTFETYFLDEICFKIIKKFTPKISIINEFIKKNNLEIKIFIIPIVENQLTPSLFFNKKFINFIYKLNAEIDIDMYINW